MSDHWHWNCQNCGAYGDVSFGHESEMIARSMARRHTEGHVVDLWLRGFRADAEQVLALGVTE